MAGLSFEIEIGPGSDGSYPVTARAPGGGEAAAIMRLPLNGQDLESQLAVVKDAVLASSAIHRRIPTPPERPVQELGRDLFDALVTGDVRVLFGTGYQQARQQGIDLRLVLRIQPPELARLPWEFLFDAGRDDYLSLRLPLVRYPQVMEPLRPLKVSPPLRLLGMVALPSDRGALDVEGEQRRLREALAGLEREGRVQLSWVAGQTWRDLREAMDDGSWHVLHFIGHGGFDPATDEGVLALAGEDGGARLLGATDLRLLLCDHHPLRLVVLNACETGRASKLGAFSSTAGALIRGGVPAVVAMQFEISDRAAIEFARTFYEGIARQRPVDVSVMRARRAMSVDHHTLEWGTPVLYLRSPDADIFDVVDAAVGPPESAPLSGLRDQGLAAFWNERWDEAVEVFGQILARQPDDADARAKLLHARYAQTCAAAEAKDWDAAVAGFTAVLDADPAYRDARQRLGQARCQQTLAGLVADLRRLYKAEQWRAVVRVGEHLAGLDRSAADPDGLVTAAWAHLTGLQHRPEMVQVFHCPGAVYAVTFSPDGRWLATASDDMTARIWDVVTGREHVKVTHDGGVPSVAFSPDGRWLATASDDMTARIWDVVTGREHVKVAHDNLVRSVAFSPDGRWLATASGDKTGRVWALQEGGQQA
ncbi:MAG: CHAT domain-containing protein [Egibacteraceae bacterium]